MSDTLDSLGRKISGAADLGSVVRTMKVLAASNIHQYEKAVLSLNDYFHTIELGLSVCFRKNWQPPVTGKNNKSEYSLVNIVVFGSDQGLVGQFNDVLCEYVIKESANIKGEKKIWVVGERMQARIEDAGFKLSGLFVVPGAVNTITLLVGRILLEKDIFNETSPNTSFYIFHNKPKHGALYGPNVQRLLPLDSAWQNSIAQIPWPSINLPEALNGTEMALHGLIRGYLFVSLFRACAESLASENASRLAAMQRAEKNIDELLDDLNRAYHRLRQSSIDEELFDVISGSEALTKVE
jgi:F-type H+-transporting ATPase subunit gamma